MNRILITCLLSFPIFVFAQSNYKKGTITTSNETLTGFINYREWDETPKFIMFKEKIDDKKTKNYSPTDVKGFVIDGFEKYYTYTCKISLNPTSFPNLADGRDTSFKIDIVFLKMIMEGPNLSLLSYTDSLKTRYYIQEKQGQPIELIYQEYYSGDKTHTLTDKKYVGQLQYFAFKYAPADTKLRDRAVIASYNERYIGAIVDGINGNQDKAADAKTSNIRFYAGAAINATTSSFEGNSVFGNAKSATNYTPNLNVGLDIFNNPNVQRLMLRLQLSFSYVHPQISNKMVGSTTQYIYSFNQYTGSITPQIVWNIYNRDALKIYIDGGLSLNFSTYTANNFTTNPYNNQNLTPYTLEPSWANFPIQTGVVFNKRMELFFMYAVNSAYTKYTGFSISNETYSAGIHYLFTKAGK